MEKTFGIVPASSGPYIFVVVISIIMIGVLGLMGYIGYSVKNTRFELSDGGLRISGTLYGRFVPRANIDSAGAKIIDLRVDQEYRPGMRTNGVGMPGYSAGWFRLKNREKALLFVTRESNVVYIPTTQGYSLMLSVRDAQEFQEAIRRW